MKQVKHRRTLNKARGFNLIELMIVFSIIELLAMIAMPMYSEYRKKVKWTENINIADGLAKSAMSCLQIYGESCTGEWGYIDPVDIGLTAWPRGRYTSQCFVFFLRPGEGFHVVIIGNYEVGGYRYDRGYTSQSGRSFTATQSYRDSVPTSIMRAFPLDVY
ncbi:MAG: hypothetical protein V4525_04720 [Pseudomonadota bacterium]